MSDEIEYPEKKDPWGEFNAELSVLINIHSMEQYFNIPDYLLSEYITRQMIALSTMLDVTREKHPMMFSEITTERE